MGGSLRSEMGGFGASASVFQLLLPISGGILSPVPVGAWGVSEPT